MANHSSLKVLLVQLPHPLHVWSNLPLAAGYLKSAAHKHGLLEWINIEILDPGNRSDSLIVDTIVSKEPNVLGFSMYLWNAARTLSILEEVKVRLPNIQIVVGGPEVTQDSTYIISNPSVDVAVFGEGELTFVELLKHFLSGYPSLDEIPDISHRVYNEIVITPSKHRLVDLEDTPSPYLLGFFDLKRYNEVPVFSMRDCSNACKYCSWVSRGRIRPFKIERIQEELELAKRLGIKKITIWDSAFNTSPIFEEFCQVAKDVDESMFFACFIQARLVDQRVARLLKECRFVHIDVGLQTTNPVALTNVNRRENLDEFLKGVRLLEEEGLLVIVDVILGLPGDTPETFNKTMKFIEDNQLNCRLFNLSIPPGSRLRKECEKHSIRIQPSPPFYVLQTTTFPAQEIKTAFERYEKISADYDSDNVIGNSLSYPAIPIHFVPSYQLWDEEELVHNTISDLQEIHDPVTGIILEVDTDSANLRQLRWLAECLSRKVANMLTILFLCDELACSIKVIRAFLAPISRANPHIILDVLIETESSLSGSIIGEIQSSIQRPKTFLDYRNELFSEKRGTIRNSMDLFLVVSSGEDYIQQEDCLNELDIIRSVEIADNEYAQSQIDDVLQRRGKAIFIDFAKISDIDFVLNILDMINRKNTDKRIVLFKDQVIQRTWDLKFDNKRIGQKIDKYELMIDRGLRIFSKHFDESDLIWEAVTKWNFWNFIALEIFYATRKIARFEELQT